MPSRKQIRIEKQGKSEWRLTAPSRREIYSSRQDALVEARSLARRSGATVLVSGKPVRTFYSAPGNGTLGLSDKAIRDAVRSVIAERKSSKTPSTKSHLLSKRAHRNASAARTSFVHGSLSR